MNWQQMMKHSSRCDIWPDYSQTTTRTAKCTCQRDDTVAAIEGAIKALENIKQYGRGCLCGHGEYCESCSPSSSLNSVRNIARVALDRLNALGKEVAG